jgi:hypothetical protein
VIENSGSRRKPAAVALLCFAVLPLGAWSAAREPVAEPHTWKFEVLHLKNGKAHQGLVDEETKTEIKFWEVKLPPRKEAHRFYYVFPRRDVARIERLDPREREILAARIRAINPVVKVKDERERLEKIEELLVPWKEAGKTRGLSYTSDYFVLRSTARRDVVIRAASRLEEVYSRYVDRFPRRPGLKSARPTTIVLLNSLGEYQEFLKRRGHNIFNPAYYDPRRNEIVCGSNFGRLGEALAQLRTQEQELRQQAAYLKKRYKGKIPGVLAAQIQRDRKAIADAKKQNDKIFNEVSQRLFQTLYHEGFHAYLENFVYPSREILVPCWLNEGLAQIFETAVIDAGVLRIEHVDEKRLERVQTLLKKKDLVPLADLLKSGARQFHVTHASSQQLADRYYMTSWALAYYLLMDQKMLANADRLDRYFKALKQGPDALVAFRQFTGKSVTRAEKDFHAYLARLKSDGSLVKSPKK